MEPSLEGITLAELALRVGDGLSLAGILGDTPVIVFNPTREGGPSPLYHTPTGDQEQPRMPLSASQTSTFDRDEMSNQVEALRTAVVVPITPSNRNLHEDRITVGRDPSCDIRLTSKLVSKLHIQFRKNAAEQWVIEDEGSSNGTLLNGLKIEKNEPYRIHSSDQIVLSDVGAVFLDAEGLVELCRLFQ